MMTELCDKLFLTLKEAASFLNLSVGTVRNEIKRGRLRVVRFGTEDKAVRIMREDLIAFVEQVRGVPVAVIDHSQNTQ